MTRPENPYEAASYDLNKFRERRIAERRATPRDTPDRRALFAPIEQEPDGRKDIDSGGNNTH